MAYFNEDNVKEICIDPFADCNYQDDGAIDFMLEATNLLYGIADRIFERDPKENEWYNIYVTVAADKSLVEFEIVRCSDDINDPVWFSIEEDEANLVIDQMNEEVKRWSGRTLDDLLAEAKPKYWWLIDDKTSAGAVMYTEKLDACCKADAINVAKAKLSHLTPDEINRRDALHVVYGGERDGDLDFDTITESYDLAEEVLI